LNFKNFLFKIVNVYIELSDCNHIQSQNLSVVSNFVVEFDFYATSLLVDGW